MTTDDMITRFIHDLARRDRRPRTIYCARQRLRCFTAWLGTQPVATVSEEDVERFLASRGPILPRTRHDWLCHLSSFYRWAAIWDLATSDPTARIPRPRLRPTLPRPAATDELAVAVGCADPVVRAWIVLAAYQGLRCMEIAGLRREDVRDREGLLWVAEGKGGRERLLPLHPAVVEALRVLPLPRHATDYLFLTTQGLRYRPAYLSHRFSVALADLGVQATPHQLRHWFGTSLYAHTHDLRLVQEMMGHASPQTTAVYVAFDHREARRAVMSLSMNAA